MSGRFTCAAQVHALLWAARNIVDADGTVRLSLENVERLCAHTLDQLASALAPADAEIKIIEDAIDDTLNGYGYTLQEKRTGEAPWQVPPKLETEAFHACAVLAAVRLRSRGDDLK